MACRGHWVGLAGKCSESWLAPSGSSLRSWRRRDMPRQGASLPNARPCLLLIQLYILDGQIPVSVEDFETTLFFFRISGLVGPKLLFQRVFVEGFIRNSRVFEDYGHAIVPAPVFGRVIPGLIHPDLEHAAHFHLLLQQWIVVLLEQLEKLIRVPPLRLVIVFDHKGLAGLWGRLSGNRQWQSQEHQEHKKSQFHRYLRGE